VLDLTGKVALITGGSRGLGREIASAYARSGAEVVVASRKLDACEAAAADIRAQGGKAHAVACHVGQWDQVDALVDTCLGLTGRIDVLVNNAGMSPLYDRLVDVTPELFDKVVAVNLRGPFRLGALVGEHMRDKGGGAIINVSSASAVRPSPAEAVYAAAKAGLNTLTQVFALAFGPTVRANGIMPGPFLTDISKAWDMDAVERDLLSQIALGRAGRPEEIVGLALLLASDAATYLNGETVRLDGGWLR